MVTCDVLKVFQIALAYGSCNFENFKNTTSLHHSTQAYMNESHAKNYFLPDRHAIQNSSAFS